MSNLSGLLFDTLIVSGLVVGGATYLFRDKIFAKPKPPPLLRPPTTTNGIAQPLIRASTRKKTRDFIKMMEQSGKNCIVFYGSQTGTAEDYASRLAKEASSYGLNAMTADLEEYDMNNLDRMPANTLAFFVLATYGEGEPTDNAAEFWQFLFESDSDPDYVPEFSKAMNGEDVDDPSKPLDSVKYVLFGLGNKTYEHFNAVARKVDAKLQQLGAARIGERGEGDDDANLEEDFLAWKDDMWLDVCNKLGLKRVGGDDDTPKPLQFTLTELEDLEDLSSVHYGELVPKKVVGSRRNTFDGKNPFMAPVKHSRPLFQAGDRQCVHAEIDISLSGMQYKTGDHVAIWPVNPEREIVRLAKYLGIADKMETIITVENTDPTAKKNPFPCPTTYQHALRHYIDISGCPSRQFVATLATHVKLSSPSAAAFLHRLGGDKDAYHKEVHAAHLNTGRLLELAEQAADEGERGFTVPFALIVEGLTRIQPRYYSISSSPRIHQGNVHVTAVVLETKVDDVYAFKGLATHFLQTIMDRQAGKGVPPEYMLSERVALHLAPEPTVHVPVFIRGSNFKLPRDHKTPVVMVGPGTGVAPFRGFVQERVYFKERGEKVGTTVLFYGCRRESEDFLYKEEWEQMFAALQDGEDGQDTKAFFVALSREPDKPKTYVQHMLRERKQQLWDWLHHQKGYFYVCGDAKNMARAVNQTLIDVAHECGGLEADAATKWVKDLRAIGRYQEDVWS